MSNDEIMLVENNKRLVRQFLAHFGTSNADGLIDAMTEDATWWVNGKPHLFSGAGRRTKAEAGAMFRTMRGAYVDGLEMTIIDMIAEGDSVAVEARSNATTKSGKSYSNEYAFWFRFESGKIASVREYTDLMHVKEIFA